VSQLENPKNSQRDWKGTTTNKKANVEVQGTSGDSSSDSFSVKQVSVPDESIRASPEVNFDSPYENGYSAETNEPVFQEVSKFFESLKDLDATNDVETAAAKRRLFMPFNRIIDSSSIPSVYHARGTNSINSIQILFSFLRITILNESLSHTHFVDFHNARTQNTFKSQTSCGMKSGEINALVTIMVMELRRDRFPSVYFYCSSSPPFLRRNSRTCNTCTTIGLY
jgi:hypothetical protein